MSAETGYACCSVVRSSTHGLAGVTTAVIDRGGSRPRSVCVAVGIVFSALVGAREPDMDLPRARVHRKTLLERRVLLVHSGGAVARVPLRFAVRLSHRGVTNWIPALRGRVPRDRSLGIARWGVDRCGSRYWSSNWLRHT
jgi:hypothetical protein